jgi:hypothetical protein
MQNFFNKIITGDETWCFAYDPRNTAIEFYIPSAEETEIPKVPQQDHVDRFF